MSEIAALLGLMKDVPGLVISTLAVLTVFVILWLKTREIDVANATSIGSLQIKQMQSLMEQNKQLADDLASLREKMAETYALMETMRDRIVELEELVRAYKRECDDCPGLPQRLVYLSNRK